MFIDFLWQVLQILFLFFAIIFMASVIAETLNNARIKRKLTKTILKEIDKAIIEVGEENEKSNNS